MITARRKAYFCAARSALGSGSRKATARQRADKAERQIRAGLRNAADQHRRMADQLEQEARALDSGTYGENELRPAP